MDNAESIEDSLMTKDVELLEEVLECVNNGGLFMLNTRVGAMELHGDDLYISRSDRWLAIYHASNPGGESRSHLHLKTGALKAARVVEEDGQTPYLGFWENVDCGGEATLQVYFPSFYDWANNKAPIEKHRRYFTNWVKSHGRQFEFP